MNNKYQEALNALYKNINIYTGFDLSKQNRENLTTLQQLVDKETPMKPSMIWEHADPKTRCKCSAGIIPAHNYCWNCGQKLDWSDIND